MQPCHHPRRRGRYDACTIVHSLPTLMLHPPQKPPSDVLTHSPPRWKWWGKASQFNIWTYISGNHEEVIKIFWKYGDQQHYKAIIESEMVSNPEGFTDNSSMSSGPYTTVKKPSARKALRQFLEVLDVKHRTSARRLGYAKSKRKAIRAGSMLWSIWSKRRVHTQINERVKTFLKLDSTTSPGYTVPNKKLLPENIYWRSLWDTVRSKIFITGVCPRTS